MATQDTHVVLEKPPYISSASVRELLKHNHTRIIKFAGVPWNPKFATEGGARSSELRIRDTGMTFSVATPGGIAALVLTGSRSLPEGAAERAGPLAAAMS